MNFSAKFGTSTLQLRHINRMGNLFTFAESSAYKMRTRHVKCKTAEVFVTSDIIRINLHQWNIQRTFL